MTKIQTMGLQPLNTAADKFAAVVADFNHTPECLDVRNDVQTIFVNTTHKRQNAAQHTESVAPQTDNVQIEMTNVMTNMM